MVAGMAVNAETDVTVCKLHKMAFLRHNTVGGIDMGEFDLMILYRSIRGYHLNKSGSTRVPNAVYYHVSKQLAIWF